jgi:uncharacterized protein
MTSTPTWPELGAARTVRLTTFRRSGDPVPTPVWAAPVGDTLYVTTDGTAGKTKRIRHTARVELTPCTMRGAVPDGVRPVPARARVVEDPEENRAAAAAIARKYRLGWPMVKALQRLGRRDLSTRVYLALEQAG